MPSPIKLSSARHQQPQSDETSRRGFMDRKDPNLSWPYSCPPPSPFPSTPGWFSVNGIGYYPQFPSGGVENMGMGMGMGVPLVFRSPDLRCMPAMTHPRHNTVFEAQEANKTSANGSSNGAVTAAAAAASPRRSSPPAADNANSNTVNSVLATPSQRRSPMTVNEAMQCLAGHLRDAIRLCADALQTHADFVATVHFATAETRNGVWSDLLEHKLRRSGFLQDGFNNLGRRLGYYMEQACCAAQNDPVLSKGDDPERRREAQGRVRCLRLLRAMCDEVVGLSDGSSVDVLDCKEMLGLMRDMEKRLDRKASGSHDETKLEQREDKQAEEGGGEEGGISGDVQSPEEVWNAAV